MTTSTYRIGDSAELLTELEPNSVDLIVTDPPYFLINDSGSGFMGKEWDSINTKNAIQIICRSKDFARFVERFSWSLRVESYTVEGSTVLPSVSMRPEGEATSELSSPAPSVVSSSSVAPPRSRATIPPVQGIVITRRELLDYLSVSSPSPTTASGRSPDDALFVVPSSFIQSLPSGIVPESALSTTIGNGCEGTIIQPSSTDEARIRDVTEAMIGSASGSKCTAATISDAESAGRNAESARYKLITLGDGENQRTTTWIISLLYAISVTPRSKSEFTHALITQFHRNWLDEALRVLKPGAFAFICTAPRSDCVQDLSIAVKDAGFNIAFTPLFWAYATGFPKAMNIGKAVDKRNGTLPDESQEFAHYIRERRLALGIGLAEADKFVCGGTTNYSWFEGRPKGQRLPRLDDYLKIKELLKLDGRFDGFMGEAEREVIGQKETGRDMPNGKGTLQLTKYTYEKDGKTVFDITAPATPQAKALDGAYAGFQPKPAVEVIMVAMKPLDQKTYVDQALANGKGVTWLDDARIPFQSEGDKDIAKPWGRVHPERGNFPGWELDSNMAPAPDPNQAGRFPANLLVSDEVLDDGTVHGGGARPKVDNNRRQTYREYKGSLIRESRVELNDSGGFSRYFSLDKWAETLPFLIVPKASKGEKNKGCERNAHPTVKPLKLMSYLITLGSRPGDVVLDPFAGSGTTLLAARMLNRSSIGFELSPEYVEVLKARTSWMPPPLEAFSDEVLR